MELRDIDHGELEVLGVVSTEDVTDLVAAIEERDVRLLYLDQAKVPAIALADALVQRFSGHSGPNDRRWSRPRLGEGAGQRSRSSEPSKRQRTMTKSE